MRKQEEFSQNALMIVNSHVTVNKESTEDFASEMVPVETEASERKTDQY